MGEPDYSPDRGAPQTKPAPRLDGSCTGRSGGKSWPVATLWVCAVAPRMRTAAGWLVPRGLRTESGA